MLFFHPNDQPIKQTSHLSPDATISIANVENAHHSTRLLAQTTLRNMLGTHNLHEILSDRETIATSMQVGFFLLYIFLFTFYAICGSKF